MASLGHNELIIVAGDRWKHHVISIHAADLIIIELYFLCYSQEKDIK